MKFGLIIAVFVLSAYVVDSRLYGGKFTGAANEIVSRVMQSFR